MYNLYYDYPAGTDVQTVCATPTANRADCKNVVGDLTSMLALAAWRRHRA